MGHEKKPTREKKPMKEHLPCKEPRKCPAHLFKDAYDQVRKRKLDLAVTSHR